MRVLVGLIAMVLVLVGIIAAAPVGGGEADLLTGVGFFVLAILGLAWSRRK